MAGITIASVTDEKGIIKEARTAKELAEVASLEEQVDLSIIKAEQKYRNPMLKNVIEELKNNKVISKDEQVDTKTGTIKTNAGDDIAVTDLDKNIYGYTFDADHEGNVLSGKAEKGVSVVLKMYFKKI